MIKVSDKLIRRSLYTDDYSQAVIRLPGLLTESMGANNAFEAGTFGAAINTKGDRTHPTTKVPPIFTTAPATPYSWRW